MTASDQFDHETDILVVGSGAGAMTAALRAAHEGADVVIAEKGCCYGGTSATSGGGLWIPCNHLMLEAGVDDTPAEAMAYLSALAGDDVPPANVRAYADQGAVMLRWLEQHSEVRYMAMTGYADYYQELEGAKTGGRSIDPLPYDARELGDDFLSMQAPHAQNRVMGLMGYTNLEGAVLLSKSPGWARIVARLSLQYFSDLPWRLRSSRSRRLVMGNALIGRLRKSLMAHNMPLWLNAPAVELIAGDNGVIGAVVERDGRRLRVRARRGVVLGSGGFEHSQTLREAYLPQPSRAAWSAGNPTNTGDMLVAAQRVGADCALLDEAWWGPTICVAGEDRARMLFAERSMPGCIMVNRAGERFVNESVAYTTAVQAMYRGDNLPCYVLFDARYKREYPFGPLLPQGMHLNWLQSRRVRRRLLRVGRTIDELAAGLGVDGDGLKTTVERFNGYAHSGVDEQFRRGENAYDLLYGDARISPNPCLAPIAEGPFYGVEIFPGDIGTKGGLRTNEHAEVLDAAGRPLGGLYAIGNCAASVTGRYYPGAGATLGPAMTFGFIAAGHACRRHRE